MEFLETAKYLYTDQNYAMVNYLDFNSSLGEDQKYPHLKLVSKNKVVDLESFKITSTINEDTISDLKLFHSVDGDSIVKEVLESESILQKQKKLLDLYNNLGEASTEEMLNGWKKTLRKIFPRIIYKTYLTNSSIEGSNNLIHQIILNSSLIGSRCRRGSGDFIICNAFIGTLIQNHPSFVYSDPGKVYSNTSPNIRSIGNIVGKISVFVDPNKRFKDNTLIVGKTTQNNDPGVYIVENKSSREIIETSLSDLRREKFLIERLAFIDIENSHKNFIKIDVEFTKKPFWKKILFI